MRKNTLPAFHRCQQSAIMTSILYDLDSKKQIRYIADLLFHLCNISLSKLYTDLCNSVAAALNQLLIMGDHKNGSAAPRFTFQFFCDQAHILPVKAAGGLIEYQYPAAGKNGAGNGKALLLPAGQGRRVRVPVLVKAKLFEQVPCMALAFFRQSGIQQQLLRHACREELR